MEQRNGRGREIEELSGRHYEERKGGVTGGKTRGKREKGC